MKVCEIDLAAEELLPPRQRDNSGIGVYYIDAYIKPMNTRLPDGTVVTCKRRGLKIALTVGDKKGEALVRRIEGKGDLRAMLLSALDSAAEQAGARLEIEQNEIHLSAVHQAAGY